MDVTPAVADRIRQANLDVHQREAPLYDALHSELLGPFSQRRIARDLDVIARALPQEAVIRVMDIGCGTGNLTLNYLRRGYHVRAIDLSPDMIAVLRGKLSPAERTRAELVVGDAEAVLDDEAARGSWDVISFSSVLHHLPHYEPVLRAALAQLKPGGLLYVCHEPLRREPAGTGGARSPATLLGYLDDLYLRARVRLVHVKQSLRDRRVHHRIDYQWSDYHVPTGLDVRALVNGLEAQAARPLLVETYKSYYCDLLASLAARLGPDAPDHFRFIVQRA